MITYREPDIAMFFSSAVSKIYHGFIMYIITRKTLTKIILEVIECQ